MIPKKIHYVWFGGKEKSNDIIKCMKTWEEKLPDYEFIEWNEENFVPEKGSFVDQALKNKKWAFVSDYIRMYAVYTQGGIYLDTDVIVLKSFDSFLSNLAFVGFEDPGKPFSAVFGAEAHNEFVKKNLDLYDNLNFDPSTEGMKKIINTDMAAKILINDFGCSPVDVEQHLESGIHVYDSGVLCRPSRRSVSIHVMSASWQNSKLDFLRFLRRKMRLSLTTNNRAAFVGMLRKATKLPF